MIAYLSAVVIIVFLFFVLKNKRMPLFEMLFVWQLTYFIYATLVMILALNLNLIKFLDKMPEYIVICGYRFVTVPMLATWAVDWAYRKHWLKKLITFAVFSLILAGIHLSLVKLKYIFYSEHWHVVYTAILFFVLIVIVELMRSAFDRVVRSEVKS